MTFWRKHSGVVYKWMLAAAVNVAAILPWYVTLFALFGGEPGMA